MAILDHIGGTSLQWIWLAFLTIATYLLATTIYLLYLHPASKFPGPKFAAISYISYSYHWIRGRYPWYQEAMIHTYGDVVRVAPNEIVFFTPQAAMDIYSPAVKNQELFVKTDLMDFGAGDLGYIWESDPAKRKAVSKKILPAFSSKATKAKEPIVHKWMDLFISRMTEVGNAPRGVCMNDWLLWLSVDMSADLAYSRELYHLRDGKTSDFVELIRGTSFMGTLIQLSKKLPIIAFLVPLFVPLKAMRAIPAVFRANRAAIKARIDKMGETKHTDFMDFMISPEVPLPSTKKEVTHIEQVALQIFVAGFDPVQIIFYASIFFLLKYPNICAILTKDIRDAFKTYDEITTDALVSLGYLQAYIHETMRVHLTAPTGMPRISPGATVDGVYVPKGVVCQLSIFTAMRHERYFSQPLEFHPERWLSPEHQLYDARYANDNLKAIHPFSLGPRQCPGKEIAWSQIKLFLGKVLWAFDLEGVQGQDKSFDKDFSVHAMWNRPDLYVRFLPAKGQTLPGKLSLQR